MGLTRVGAIAPTGIAMHGQVSGSHIDDVDIDGDTPAQRNRYSEVPCVSDMVCVDVTVDNAERRWWLGDYTSGLRRVPMRNALMFEQHVCVLVKNGLQAAEGAVLGDTKPIGLVRIQRPHERRHVWKVEKRSKSPGNPAGLISKPRIGERA